MLLVRNYRGLEDWRKHDQGKFSVEKLRARNSASVVYLSSILLNLPSYAQNILQIVKEFIHHIELICSTQVTCTVDRKEQRLSCGDNLWI